MGHGSQNITYCQLCLQDSVYFDCTAVMKAMSKLKPNLASGPDGLPPLLFKRLGKHIALMFGSFFSIHHIPSEWSKSIVTPVFKPAAHPVWQITGLFH